MTIVIHRKAPALPFVPAELHGELVVGVVCCYAGPVEEGEKVVRPLKAFGSPVLDLCEPKPYLDHQAMFDPSFPHGWWYYIRSCDVAELTDDVIDITVEHAMRIELPAHELPDLADGRRGRPRRRGRDRLQRPRRRATPSTSPATTETAEGFDEEREWARDFWSALAAPPHERLRELPHGRGRGAGPRRPTARRSTTG